MNGELQGQVALITGGAGAIGRAIGEGFVQAGARVVLVDIDADRLDEFGQQLEETYGPDVALLVAADVRYTEQVRGAFDQTLQAFGRLDILVNNAAVTQIRPVDELSDEEIDVTVDTNLKGYLKCAREAVRIMKAAGTGGKLLIISSKNGLEGAGDKCLYSSTKGGELTMARSLARELGRFGIRVNSICPDAVLEGSGLWENDDYRLGTARRYNLAEDEIPGYYKERCALKTNVKPEDVANAALFLVSERSAKTTGSILTVDGGVAFVR